MYVCVSHSDRILVQTLNSLLVVLDLKSITIVYAIIRGETIFESLIDKYFGHQKKESNIFWCIAVTVFSS
jgi:hypothetical protein